VNAKADQGINDFSFNRAQTQTMKRPALALLLLIVMPSVAAADACDWFMSRKICDKGRLESAVIDWMREQSPEREPTPTAEEAMESRVRALHQQRWREVCQPRPVIGADGSTAYAYAKLGCEGGNIP
jgi:hypothetical protein